MLPPLAELRLFMDQMRQLSPLAYLSANNKGELKLAVHDTSISAEAHWNQLSHPHLNSAHLAHELIRFLRPPARMKCTQFAFQQKRCSRYSVLHPPSSPLLCACVPAIA